MLLHLESSTRADAHRRLLTHCAVGDQFHERQDQQACLDILKRTEKDHARPTEAVQRQMMKSWDMNEEMRT